MPLTIYLAGPDVFLPDARDVGRRKQEMCSEYGFLGLFPLDKDADVGADPGAIFRANCRLMERASIGVFNLAPFRGPSADAGTTFEVGFMFAQRKKLFGYTSVKADYAARVAANFGPLVQQGADLRDHNGYGVENFGLCDNLMIVRAIMDSGGTISAVAENEARQGTSLAAFEAFKMCLEAVRLHTASQTMGAR
jgi:nucleoside 2-deoxyribosyltransferase